MEWDVRFDLNRATWFAGLAEALQDEILAHVALLRRRGPRLGRPSVDTVEASAFSQSVSHCFLPPL